MKKSTSHVRVKDADQGTIEAVFASHLIDRSTLASADAKCIDKDGDVTLKGAFTDGQPVVISAYGHGSWEGKLPVGKGVIREVGDLAVMEGQFFLDTPEGLNTFTVVKALSEDDLQEWSYSYHEVTASRTKVAGRNVRVLERIGLVKEVSPVLMGAGVETRTLAAKSADSKQLNSTLSHLLRIAARARWASCWVWLWDYDVDEGYAVFGLEDCTEYVVSLVRVSFTRTDTAVELGDDETEVIETAVFVPKSASTITFSEHAAAVVAAVDELTARASEVVALRAEKGKTISVATLEQLRLLAGHLDTVKALVDQPAPDTIRDQVQHELLRFIALSHQGV